jgi:hypothetical protein
MPRNLPNVQIVKASYTTPPTAILSKLDALAQARPAVLDRMASQHVSIPVALRPTVFPCHLIRLLVCVLCTIALCLGQRQLALGLLI